MQDQNLDNPNPKKNSWLVPFLVSSIVIGILAAIALPSFLNQSSKAKAVFTRMSIAGIMKTQSKNYGKTGKFLPANELSGDLTMASFSDRDNSYEFQSSLKGDTVALVTATPKRDGLASYTGINFRDSYWICETVEWSKTPPQIDKNEFTSPECPAGSRLTN